ncbi:MAG: DNA mismatch repair endonuclease MutL [Acidobacteriota bacterium]
MARIHLLDDHLISQIAAGEVVERPSSVVKELVENSLDAGAKEVRLELEAGGKRRIVVTDDGRGMSGDDVLLAFDRHATSKIERFEDLEEVATLGFRGEALASIAAVSRVELRTAEAAGEGQRVRIEGGRMKSVEPVACPKGTRIEVASLFFNVPARRKFLKKPATELRRATEVVQGYALAHPEVRFAVHHEGRALLETPPVTPDPQGLRERLAQVFGRDLVEKLHEIPVDFVTEEEAITGFVGGRETSRGRRIFLYVNRRLVRDRILLARFYRAVRDEWRSEDFPALFLFLELRPDLVDVNVHPQKAEVRFRDLSIADRVEDALRRTLDGARSQGSAPLAEPRSLPAVPAAWEGLGGRPSRLGDAGPAGEVASPGPLTPWAPGRGGGRGTGYGSSAGELRESEAVYGSPGGTGAGGVSTGDLGGLGGRRADPVTEPVLPGIARPHYRPIEPSKVPLAGRGKDIPPFRLLGQYKGSLILLEGHDGLYLIDQHAAHERILYERLRSSLAEQSTSSQALLEPILLELAPSEAMRLRELTEALGACGFDLRDLSGDDLALAAIPDVLTLEDAESIVRGLANAGDVEGGDVEAVRRRLLKELAAEMSCRAAIKIHRPMPVAEMEALVSELFAAEQPYACPHGRPTVLHMGDADLERRFGRR